LSAGGNGRWAVEHFIVEPEGLQPYLVEDGRICPPGTYTRLVHYDGGVPPIDETGTVHLRPGGHLVMSDTRAEIEDHQDVMNEIQRRGGRILIHGLGLGMIVKFALAEDRVSHVDVVELDQEVIDLVAPHYVDRRLTIHQGDARSFRWPAGTRWSIVWHDIWDDLSIDNLKQMAALHRRFGPRADWQGSWSMDYLRAQRRWERKSAARS